MRQGLWRSKMTPINELAKAAKTYTREAHKVRIAVDSGKKDFDYRAYVAAEIALHAAAINFADLAEFSRVQMNEAAERQIHETAPDSEQNQGGNAETH